MAQTVDPETELARARIGRVLGEWTLESLIGIGGMAAVYAATSKDGKRAALKVLHADMSRRLDVRQRFAQEGMAASRVVHPGVVKVLGTGDGPDGSVFIVMELLDGEPLSATLKRAGTLALPRLVDVLDQVLDVLAAAHAQNIVHRDLKPDNLFVTTGGRIKVLDFGIARVLDDIPGAYKTSTNVTLGTVPFMSPEQALGKRDKVDRRSDLFSLGAMAFRIVTGRNVHLGDSDAEVLVAMASKPAPTLASVAPKVSPGLAAIVDLALAFSRETRYPDAKTMQDDVRALAEGRVPPYASGVHRARGMSTRIDIPAPVVPDEAVREATASTEPVAMRSPPVIATVPEGGLGTAATTTTPDDAPPTTAPPSSRRAFAMPATPDRTVPAKTQPNPAFTAPTAEMPAARVPGARTLISSEAPGMPSAPPRPRSSAPVAIVAALAAAAGVFGGYIVFTGGGLLAPAPEAPASAPAAAAPVAAAAAPLPVAPALSVPAAASSAPSAGAAPVQAAAAVPALPGAPAAPPVVASRPPLHPTSPPPVPTTAPLTVPAPPAAPAGPAATPPGPAATPPGPAVAAVAPAAVAPAAAAPPSPAPAGTGKRRGQHKKRGARE